MTTTGLPELPVGQVWHVAKRYNYYDHVHYQISIKFLEKRRFRRPRYVSYGPDGLEANAVIVEPLTPDHIRWAADQVIEKVKERTQTSNLLGFYPPNTLDVQDG